MNYHPVQLDKVRNFKYGMRALNLIEKKMKKPVAQIDMENLTMEDTATLIWAGLQHEDKDLTVEKVMDLVDDYSNIQAVMGDMTEALYSAFGITGPEENDEGDIKNE